MQAAKAILGLVGTVAIAGWVAYSVSAPRNFENAMNEPMESLGGSTIAESVEKAQAEARQAQCEEIRARANEAWDRAIENGTADRDAERLDELYREVGRYCD